MFTGIIEDVGRVVAFSQGKAAWSLQIAASLVTSDVELGCSVAVNGCCLTAVAVTLDGFTCELTTETLQRTAFEERLKPGARVNLERPMRADGRFDGHIVQGHVDGVGRVKQMRWLGESAELVIAPPRELERYLVVKGSITVDGVSLTVASLERGSFGVALIPYTLNQTTLPDAEPGAPVSLEADVIAKYVERLLPR